jgi:hypothetical protein
MKHLDSMDHGIQPPDGLSGQSSAGYFRRKSLRKKAGNIVLKRIKVNSIYRANRAYTKEWCGIKSE